MANQISFTAAENHVRVNFLKQSGENVFVGAIEKGRTGEYLLKMYDIPPHLNTEELAAIAKTVDKCNKGKFK